MSNIELIEPNNSFNKGTCIKVFGVGGGGGNAVEHMIEHGIQGIDFVCANTDSQALSVSTANCLIQLGNDGLGAGSKPDQGREAAVLAESEIRKALEGADMVFITAGMGGGTGTGAAPVIARIAKEMKILTVAVVTKPFDWEGTRRLNNAAEGLKELENNVDSLIVVLNEKLLSVYGDDITQEEAFGYVNDVLRNAVGGIAEIINKHGKVNVDFSDVKTVMNEPGKAMMGTAVASGPDRAQIAAQEAISCPLLEGANLSGAKGILVLVTASKASLKLNEGSKATSAISAYAAEGANIIFGSAYDDSLGDDLRVTVLATGLSDAESRRQDMTMVHGGLATGTHDALPPAGGFRQAGARSVGAPVAGFGSMRRSPATGGASNNLAMPDVWLNPRSTNASAKVDALSSGGMDDVEIPAFLRKQAD